MNRKSDRLKIGIKMGYEYKIIFHEAGWLSTNLKRVKGTIRDLETFVESDDDSFCLLGFERRGENGRWLFDVRLFLDEENEIFVEISSIPDSISEGLSILVNWFVSVTEISVVDDDGKNASWKGTEI